MYWDEYSVKQVLLSSFFGRGAAGSGVGKDADLVLGRMRQWGMKEEMVAGWRESKI